MTTEPLPPIPPDDLDAMTDALNGYRKAVAQANACTSVDGVVDALEVIVVAANKAMPHFSRLLAEAREAQRLRENSAIAQHTGKVLLKAAQDEIAQLTARVEALKRYEDFYNNNQAYLDQAAWEANGGVPAISWAEALQKTNNQLQARVAELVEALEDIKGQCETDFVGCSRCGADEPLTDTDVYDTARQAIAKAKRGGVR